MLEEKGSLPREDPAKLILKEYIDISRQKKGKLLLGIEDSMNEA